MVHLVDMFMIVVVAFLLGMALRDTMIFVFKRLWGVEKQMMSYNLIVSCSHIIPPMIIIIAMNMMDEKNVLISPIFQKIINVYFVVSVAMCASAVLSLLWVRYDSKRNTKNLPLKGLRNVGNGIIWILASIVAISELIGKSPTVLLTGLGAFAAALMLIFKDSILGFVAGVQLSQNDMLRVGDWIVVPATIANGVVEDVSLSVVKIRNWDNTMVMLPPYTLVSTSFQNWRGMSEKRVRQIVASVLVDNSSIKHCDKEFIDKIIEIYPEMEKFVTLPHYYGVGVAPINGTTETNLGLFRAYLCNYLFDHKMIDNNSQILVRLLDTTDNGIPLQVYCYSNTTDWAAYEAVKSEIMEHIFLQCPLFGITIYTPLTVI